MMPKRCMNMLYGEGIHREVKKPGMAKEKVDIISFSTTMPERFISLGLFRKMNCRKVCTGY
ncbi:hypothetical protein C0V97_09225 [Asaia sp. W19]|nr:hypothetical protein C0V97_09225 [Asaia sp. W19]